MAGLYAEILPWCKSAFGQLLLEWKCGADPGPSSDEIADGPRLISGAVVRLPGVKREDQNGYSR
jgi:hypothetical protein